MSDESVPNRPKLPGDKPRPKLPGGSPSARNARGNSGTWIALFGVLLGCAFLLLLTAMILPSFVGIVGVVVGSFFFFLLHYMTWGRWLMNNRRTPDEEERHW